MFTVIEPKVEIEKLTSEGLPVISMSTVTETGVMDVRNNVTGTES